jgi:uncharacterized RDD family membrane protein YckC
MADDEWFYAKGEQQIGPVPLQQLRELANAGELRREDLVWTEGRTQWIPAGTIPAIFETAVAQPPPIAPIPPGMPINYFSPSFDARYAGFWLRFCAAFLDSLIVVFAFAIVGGCIGGVIGVINMPMPGNARSIGPEMRIILNIVEIFAAWVYAALMESSSIQATLGKMALGIKVTDEFGNRISFGRASGRHFSKWISAMTLMIGYIMAGFTERKQALHDIIAGTLVVKK